MQKDAGSIMRHLRRWKWLDWLFVRIEAYTALVEQYPFLKWLVRAAGTAMLVIWTYLGESWLPLAIVSGLAALLVMHYWPYRTQSESTTRSVAQRNSSPSAVQNVEEIDGIYEGVHSDLMWFAIDHVLPVIENQIALQDAIIRHVCDNEKVVMFAGFGLTSNYDARRLGRCYERLCELCDSPPEYIPLDELMKCIGTIEKDYTDFCSQADRLAEAASLDYRTHPDVKPIWYRWAEVHNSLVEAYEIIRRDMRLPVRFLRPGRPSRWGALVTEPSDEG